ncbi:MAG: ATP-dependent DNA helicase RecG [Elusimicrobiota bacterium]
MTLDLQRKLKDIKGVGPARAGALASMGLYNVNDLLGHLPLRYEDRRKITEISEIRPGLSSCIKARVVSFRFISLRGRKSLLKLRVRDKSAFCVLLFFNQPYLKKMLKKGEEIFVCGRFEQDGGVVKSSNFTFAKADDKRKISVHFKRIVPVYSAATGISRRWLRELLFNLLKNLENDFLEFVPQAVAGELNLYGINEAFKKIHFPRTFNQAFKARRSLITGEFLLYQTALALNKESFRSKKKEHGYKVRKNLLVPYREKMGFEFTSHQKVAIKEIFSDMLSPYPMRRLLQGEVGSGKTAVALAAILLAIENSYQGAVVAPTEILAEQHYLSFKKHCSFSNIKISLLTGGISRRKRQGILKDIESGRSDIVVGTHALFEQDINLSRVKLLVIDEQHRFGVKQKSVILERNPLADCLSMSATPIPRAVAMCSYGDLDVSVIKELPHDRKRPLTKYMSSEKAYAFARNEIAKGNRVYIVHPVIDESDESDLKSAKESFDILSRREFKEFSCGLLHGRMKSEEKDRVMKDFASGRFSVLFSTTVVEVGINVPEATVMIIENFERYGLATLHQLRGRIGRSSRRSYCFLSGNLKTENARKRLKIILSSSDGFKIAEEDMNLRGTGALLDTMQHGEAGFKFASPAENIKELIDARRFAFKIVSRDNLLESKEYRPLKIAVEKKYGDKFHFAYIS